jgi:hypothetical protein
MLSFWHRGKRRMQREKELLKWDERDSWEGRI